MENFFLWAEGGVPCAPLTPDLRRRAGTRRRARGRSRPCRGRRARRRCRLRGRGPTRLLRSPSRPRRRGAIRNRGATRHRSRRRRRRGLGTRPRPERGSGARPRGRGSCARVSATAAPSSRVVLGTAASPVSRGFSAFLDRDRDGLLVFFVGVVLFRAAAFFYLLAQAFVATALPVCSLACFIAVPCFTP